MYVIEQHPYTDNLLATPNPTMYEVACFTLFSNNNCDLSHLYFTEKKCIDPNNIWPVPLTEGGQSESVSNLKCHTSCGIRCTLDPRENPREQMITVSSHTHKHSRFPVCMLLLLYMTCT